MIRIISFGDERQPGELRIGAVGIPPRGLPRGAVYDLWMPEISPSKKLRREFKHGGGFSMREYLRRFKAEMSTLERKHLIRFVADLARSVNFDISVGCYCRDEDVCHRSVLRDLLGKEGVEVADVSRVDDDHDSRGRAG